MEQSQPHSKFLSTQKEREKLIKQITKNYFSKKLNFGWIYFFPFLALGLTPMAGSVIFFNAPSSHVFISILIGVTLITMWFLPLSFLKRRLKLRSDQKGMWRNLDRYHGGIYVALAKIRLLLEDEETPLYTIRADNHAFHIIENWYININYKDVVHISEIAAIVSGNGYETYIIFSNERTSMMMLGKYQHDDVFDLIHGINPHVLHTNDKVHIPVEVKEAHRRKRYSAIVEEHNRRKSDETVLLTDDFWENLGRL